MRVQRLELNGFRTYSAEQFLFFPGVTVIVGPNASGKTVLLEAVAFLSRGKSPRASQDKAMLQWNQSEGKVHLRTLSQSGVYQHVEARFQQNETQHCRVAFRLNDKPVKSRSEIIGRVPTVTFFASDLLMLRGAPEDRRQLLDQALSQFDPHHFDLLKRYQHIKTQKAALLKQAQAGGYVGEMLGILNKQLIEVGAQIIFGRLAYLRVLSPWMREAYTQMADGQESLELGYASTLQETPLTLDTATSLEALSVLYQQAIDAAQADEIRRGVVLIGPHRDDIRFTLDDHDASEFASQGQQRSIVLAFKAAELHALRDKLGQEAPILLLDDVMAELDTRRQAALLALFAPDLQVLMTTTHLDQTLSLLHDLEYHVIDVTQSGQPEYGQQGVSLPDIATDTDIKRFRSAVAVSGG